MDFQHPPFSFCFGLQKYTFLFTTHTIGPFFLCTNEEMLYLCTILSFDMKITIQSKEELPAVASALLNEFPNERVFCLYGEMGAGKTTLIKEVCRQLGATDTTSSPTFAIVNEYLTDMGDSIYHFDFYRIEKIADAYEIGAEDYLYSGNYCFLEWPENVEELIQPDFIKLRITVNGPQSRTFETFSE